MYFGEKEIKIAYSDDLLRWNINNQTLLAPRIDSFDNSDLEVSKCI